MLEVWRIATCFDCEPNVWLAMLKEWRAQQFARNHYPSTVDTRRSIVLRFPGFAES